MQVLEINDELHLLPVKRTALVSKNHGGEVGADDGNAVAYDGQDGKKCGASASR